MIDCVKHFVSARKYFGVCKLNSSMTFYSFFFV